MKAVGVLGTSRKNSNTAIVLNRLISGYSCEVVDVGICPVGPYNYEHEYPAEDQFLRRSTDRSRAPDNFRHAGLLVFVLDAPENIR